MTDNNPHGYHDAETFRRGVTSIDQVRDHIAHRDAYHRALNDHIHRSAMPPIADKPAPAQSFDKGSHSGREAAVSRQVTDFNRPREE